MSAPVAQPELFAEIAAAGYSLEWDLLGDPRAAWAALAELDPAGAIVGIGFPLVAAVGAAVPGLRIFTSVEGRASMPATQSALWTRLSDATPGGAFTQADRLAGKLSRHFRLIEATALFRYGDGRDLTGYRDGTGNPTGYEAQDAVLIQDGECAGGAFALVQRYVHDRPRFFALDQAARDNVIGRRLSDDEEMDDAPDSAHVKRTDQEGYDEPAFMLRKSMPWGDPIRHGLVFVAFASDLGRIAKVLRRMCGLEDGVVDALLSYTRAETGSYYYCPPMVDGRLKLPDLHP
jgi:putative iron-dependent peroxidase